MVSLYAWMWALAWSWIVGITAYERLGTMILLRISVTILLSTLIACSLCYLVAEEAMRPLFARVLDDGSERSTTVGVMPRLVLAWVIGSASYFIAIALLLTSVPSSSLGPYVLGACAFALAVGAALTFAGARSVARPLHGLRSALGRVETGDLDVSVPVDDAGELGQVQSAFNRMVAGLRERDRLELLFGRHVGRDVAERAVASESLRGDELDATVMFVDVVGSTTLAAERTPQAVSGSPAGCPLWSCSRSAASRARSAHLPMPCGRSPC
jgi:adenylate cyclase